MIKKVTMMSLLVAAAGFVGFAAAGDDDSAAGNSGELIASFGEEGYALNWDNDQLVDCSFKEFEAKGKLHFVGSCGDDPQMQFVVDPGWNYIYNGSINSDEFDCTLTAELASMMNASDAALFVKGQNYTLYSVYYIAPEEGGDEGDDDNDEYGILISKPAAPGFNLADWTPYYDFSYSGFAAGGELTIVGTNNGDAQIKIVVGDKWGDSDAVNKDNYDVKAGSGVYSIILDDNQAATLNSGTIHLQGQNFVVTGIYYKAPEGGNEGGEGEGDDDNDEYGKLISKPAAPGFDLENWEPYYDFSYSDFAAGGVLTIVGTNNGDAQIKIVVGDKWGDPDAVNKDNYDVEAGSGVYSITLDAAQASTLNSGTIHIQGTNFVITGIYYKAPEGGNEGGEGEGDDEGDDDTADNVWTGSFDCGNWQNLVIPASYAKDLKEDDKIVVYFTVNAGAEYGQLMFKNSDYEELPDLQDTATGRKEGEPTSWPVDATMTSVTCNAADAATIAASGLVISGENVTITKVVFGEGTTGVGAVESAGNAPVEYFNLQGVRLAEPAVGTMVIRRQGSEVKTIVIR